MKWLPGCLQGLDTPIGTSDISTRLEEQGRLGKDLGAVV